MKIYLPTIILNDRRSTVFPKNTPGTVSVPPLRLTIKKVDYHLHGDIMTLKPFSNYTLRE